MKQNPFILEACNLMSEAVGETFSIIATPDERKTESILQTPACLNRLLMRASYSPAFDSINMLFVKNKDRYTWEAFDELVVRVVGDIANDDDYMAALLFKGDTTGWIFAMRHRTLRDKSDEDSNEWFVSSEYPIILYQPQITGSGTATWMLMPFAAFQTDPHGKQWLRTQNQRFNSEFAPSHN